MKRILAIFLIIITLVCIFPAQAFAAAGTNEAVMALGAELAQKYGISIEHGFEPDGDVAISESSLEILDEALSTVTASVVRKVSEYYERTLGHSLTFSYAQLNGGMNASAGARRITLAGFQPDEGVIYLFLPASTGTAVVTGESPITIVHEFGHALHYMLENDYGKDKMRAEWLAMNGGIQYDPAYIAENPDGRTFVSPYAATLYEEDFAEVIGHSFIRNKAGQGFTGQLSANGQRTNLGRKMDYVDSLLAAYFPNDAAMLANFRKTLSAPTELVYQGMHLSGEYLQYIGYRQPRYVLDGTLNLLGKRRERAVWLRDIGGWYVLEPNGNEMLVFFGLNFVDVPEGFVAPAA